MVASTRVRLKCRSPTVSPLNIQRQVVKLERASVAVPGLFSVFTPEEPSVHQDLMPEVVASHPCLNILDPCWLLPLPLPKPLKTTRLQSGLGRATGATIGFQGHPHPTLLPHRLPVPSRFVGMLSVQGGRRGKRGSLGEGVEGLSTHPPELRPTV